jgi:integrase
VCLAPELVARTRLNRIRMVSQLYNFALRQEWVKENLTKRIIVPLQADHVPEYLEVQDVRRLLECAPEFGLLAYVALGLFAGIRRAELLRLDWAAVNLADREITIGPEIAKTRSRRVIPFDETLAAWLQGCPRQGGGIVNSISFERDFGALRRAAGLRRWPTNGLRHSFATYHVAHFHDPVKTAYLLGHRGGTNMLDSHYRGLVSSLKAKEYWALRPSTLVVQSALREAA